MRASATYGTPVRVDTAAARSGSTRSNAAAKIMRVEDRKTVPYHPKTSSAEAVMSSTWKTGLSTIHDAVTIGESQSEIGPLPPQYVAPEAMKKSHPMLREMAAMKTSPTSAARTSAAPIATAFLRRSRAPRTSPASVAPQFGHSSQN